MQEKLRQLPKIDEVLARSDVRVLSAPRWAVVEAIRREVDVLRQAILGGSDGPPDVTTESVAKRADALAQPSLRPVINATGVVLHTNMGRAPLADAALDRAMAAGRGYTNLEYDLDAGARGSRHGHVRELVRALTGAQDAVVVNNNAGAVMLCLAALARDREVIVSRGELIEIGGSFRIPDVMQLSGAQLVEVGTTNKTRAADYVEAITERTALLLKVHQSNFAIVGFTEQVSVGDLVALGRDRSIATMMDLGSGSLLGQHELTAAGLPAEPSVREVIATGVDLVTLSGDKLLGGPQAGIIAGTTDAVACARNHPLMRALRPDKLTIAALEATLGLYRDGRSGEVPTIAMLTAPLASLRRRAEQLAAQLGGAPHVEVSVVACESTVGGGAMPTSTLPSWGIALTPSDDGTNANDIDAGLRRATVPVIGRITDDQVVLDVRTLICSGDLAAVAAAVRGL